MKIFLFCLAVILIPSVFVCANPPERIDITVNGQRIDVFVSHPSNNPDKHYINTIKIILNGKEIKQQTFSFQKPEGQTFFYEISGLKKSDNVTVAAYCSVYGDLQKGISVR